MAYILVVDDDEPMLLVIKMTLESAGHIVSEARNGQQAAAMFEKVKYDLIITDILMPERDGLETIIALKRANPKLPVIAMTGMIVDSELYLSIAKHLGARLTLKKPFTDKQLLEAATEVLRES